MLCDAVGEDINCQKKYCDYQTQKCISGGNSKIPCETDAKCKTESKCDINPSSPTYLKCLKNGGTGILCNANIDCEFQKYRCNVLKQCVRDECGGALCTVATQNTDCNKPARCNQCGKCVPGGDGALCINDAACEPKNDPPVAKNLRVYRASCIGIRGSGAVYFQWDYSDKENDKETHFWLEIDDNSDFSSPEVLREVANPGVNQQLITGKLTPTVSCSRTNPLCKPSGFISYNTTGYYWRVKVQENADGTLQNSVGSGDGWYYGEKYVLAGHPDPVPLFTFYPNPAAPGGTVSFTDMSICYDNSGADLQCSDFTWDFGDNTGQVTTRNTSHEYKTKGAYSTTLTACDNTGVCCSAVQSVPITDMGAKDIPKWKEISPF